MQIAATSGMMATVGKEDERVLTRWSACATALSQTVFRRKAGALLLAALGCATAGFTTISSISDIRSAGIGVRDVPGGSRIVRYHVLHSFTQINPSLGVCPLPPPGLTQRTFKAGLAEEVSRGKETDAHFFDLTECAWLTRNDSDARAIYTRLARLRRHVTNLARPGNGAFLAGTPRQSQLFGFRMQNIVVVLQYYENNATSRVQVSETHLGEVIARRLT